MDRKTIVVIVAIIILAITSYFLNQDDNDQSNHYYMFKMDEKSESWELDHYTVELVPTYQIAGYGELSFVGDERNVATEVDLQVTAYLEEGIEILLQSKTYDFDEPTELSTLKTDSTETDFFKPNGDPVIFDEIKTIEAVIHWSDGDQIFQEEMELYNKYER
ncbi:hypothetical protein [Aquisalibacillus elongatus]|uniref:Uncharacterized protein n=1 Tax=Aquisalibacillus elongatus TaxID=485577 RepID=A0A3N5CBC1_9BACI|nr:hypothetical protein [Aquisalibacillus elongatus]RPF54121.1 hypothetical protein EDC24_1309 [Aquisalibacillus elongatus]